MSKTLRMTEAELAELQRKRSVQKGEPVNRPCQREKRAKKHELEDDFDAQLRTTNLRRPVRQYSPFLDRAIRLDFAWPVIPSDPHLDWQPGIAFEVQGMVHRIKARFKYDARRHNMLTAAGWTLYYVTGEMVRDGSALALAKQVLR